MDVRVIHEQGELRFHPCSAKGRAWLAWHSSRLLAEGADAADLLAQMVGSGLDVRASEAVAVRRVPCRDVRVKSTEILRSLLD
jgi:hypothetical protein